MKNEFVLAFNEVLEEKQLPKEVILQAIESAMVSAYRRAVNASNAQQIEAKIDPDSGKVSIFAEKEVVDSVQDPRTEVVLSEARRYDPAAELGSMVVVESTPHDFGRVAAQTARQVIQQRIRDAERQAQLNYYQKQLGEIISGVVQALNSQGLTIGLEMRAEGAMSRKDMIPGERFRIHDRVRALVAEVKDNPRGPQIILSRTHRDFLRRLLENEVPEIYHGVVEIRSISREPGERAKVAVSATQSGIDPVGACVGIRGVRIQAIVRELHDEKIDVIEWNPDPAIFIAKAISPARVVGVYLNDHDGNGKTATVVVPEDQLSLAIGRDGQNARLAAKLTNWRIDIKSLTEAAADAIHRLQTEPSLSMIAEAESERIPSISGMLGKKAEGRPLTPEEYDQMAQFVDRVEKRTTIRRIPEKPVIDKELEAISQGIPQAAFEENILDSSLPEHVAYILQEAGYTTVGELAVQMKRDADAVFRLQGIGPRALNEIKRLMESIQIASQPETAPVTEEQPMEMVQPETVELQVTAEPEEKAVVEEPIPVSPVELPEQPVEPAEPKIPEVEEVILGEAQPLPEEEIAQEVEPSFDELFSIRSEMTEPVEFDEDEEELISGKAGKKKGKKKRRFIEIEYDPDRDLTVSRKKHKRGAEEWDTEP